MIARVGDHDGDGTDDIVVADFLGGAANLFLGDVRIEIPEPSARVEGKVFNFDLATPRLMNAFAQRDGLDLSNDNVAPLTSGEAFVLRGEGTGDALANTQEIGDINDDGFDDFLINGIDESYILLGPVELTGLDRVIHGAAILIDGASLGAPARRMGDLNGDQIGDLGVYQEHR